MVSVSPLDASILTLLSKVPKQVKGRQKELLEHMRRELLERLSPEAREIGQAVLAEDGAEHAFSASAQETARELKRGARANNYR
ncbi:MAG TPA: hypothetical protein VOA87_05525 [Thermoanaerobaculia bacterium]|nr:hypothetical protein [Thermoanaerobaculia bacterium]